MTITKGTSKFKARSRLMNLLGEQLITDELAALSELIKNAYDADAKKVEIELNAISNKNIGEIIIKDNGHGMTRDSLLRSWLELGSVSKVSKDNQKKESEIYHRPYLGEKGLGRLSIHKIGQTTQIITKRKDSDSEATLHLDWSKFDNLDEFLDDIEVDWEEKDSTIFLKNDENFPNGTKIIITNLHRNWTTGMIKDIHQFIEIITSPISELKDFNIKLSVIDDQINIPAQKNILEDIFNTAGYYFNGDIDKNGNIKYNYSYRSRVHPKFHTKRNGNEDLKTYDKDYFSERKKDNFESFTFRIYGWDLNPKEKKETFSDEITYEKSVKHLTGIKVFRDGFRVLPYGGKHDDWLNMDKRRVSRFEERVSRNQVVGIIEITSKNNPRLIDKSDREGFIDNDEFRDFKTLVLAALKSFENQRSIERKKIKVEQREDQRLTKLKEQFSNLTEILDNEKISVENRKKIQDIILRINKTIDKTIDDLEEPLMAAAALGLTYMIPTHEVKRDIENSYTTLENVLKNRVKNPNEVIKNVIKQLQQADDVIQGIVNISQTTKDEKRFQIREPIEYVIDMMRNKAKRENIVLSYNIQVKKTIVGTVRLYAILLLNMIDNSIYWLKSNKNMNKKIIINFVDYDKNFFALIVSDNGMGLNDELDYLTYPFVSKKLKGMGLGLYICDRIAKNHKGKLKSFDEFDMPGLLSGANVGFLIPKE